MPEVGQDVEPEVVPLPQNPQLVNFSGTTRAAWGLCLRPGFPKPLRFCIFSPLDTFHLISSKCVFCALYLTKYQADLF